MSEGKRLIRNIVAAAIILAALVVGYTFISDFISPPLKIDETPIQIESIESIAEISTVSYKGEVVVDSVEFYNKSFDWTSMNDWWNVKDRLDHPDVKRRLTLIVKGEVKYGFDLKKDPYDIRQNQDTLWVSLPHAKLIDLEISPSKTEVFQEQGSWTDSERKFMEYKAIEKLKRNTSFLNLEESAEESAKELFKKMILPNKTVIVEFN